MNITAQEIVKSIGNGIQEAFYAARDFLEFEESEINNADIRPEYLTTVKVAEALNDRKRSIRLESMMKDCVKHAAGLMNANRLTKQPAGNDDIKSPTDLKTEFDFGQRRLDILVLTEDNLAPPALVAEVKLGKRYPGKINEDIDRIFRILQLYEVAGYSKKFAMYGAVLFHFMEEGKDINSLTKYANRRLCTIKSYLKGLASSHSWLKHDADLILTNLIHRPVHTISETYEDDTEENIFGKDQFVFAPCLVLLGKRSDIKNAINTSRNP